MKHYILSLLFLCLSVSVQAQFRMVSNNTPSWTSQNDSTYTASVSFSADQTGFGYLANQIDSTFWLFTGTEQLYRVDSVWNASFSSADLRVVEVSPTNGSPAGQVMVFDPDGRKTIPAVPFGSTGSTAQLQAAVVSWNARIVGTGSFDIATSQIVYGQNGVIVGDSSFYKSGDAIFLDPTGFGSLFIKRYEDRKDANRVIFKKSRGTKSNPTAALKGDYLGAIEFFGLDTTKNYRRAGLILPILDTFVYSPYNSAGMELRFLTEDPTNINASTRISPLSISWKNIVNIGDDNQYQSRADYTANIAGTLSAGPLVLPSLVVDSTGRVGINTEDPLRALHISGPEEQLRLESTGSGGVDNWLEMVNNSTSITAANIIQFYKGGNTSAHRNASIGVPKSVGDSVIVIGLTNDTGDSDGFRFYMRGGQNSYFLAEAYGDNQVTGTPTTYPAFEVSGRMIESTSPIFSFSTATAPSPNEGDVYYNTDDNEVKISKDGLTYQDLDQSLATQLPKGPVIIDAQNNAWSIDTAGIIRFQDLNGSTVDYQFVLSPNTSIPLLINRYEAGDTMGIRMRAGETYLRNSNGEYSLTDLVTTYTGSLFENDADTLDAGVTFQHITNLESAELEGFTATDSTLAYTGTETKRFLLQYNANINFNAGSAGTWRVDIRPYLNAANIDRANSTGLVETAGADDDWRMLSGSAVVTLNTNDVISLRNTATIGINYILDNLNLSLTEL